MIIIRAEIVTTDRKRILIKSRGNILITKTITETLIKATTKTKKITVA